MDKALWDTAKWGDSSNTYSRWNVTLTHWDTTLAKFEQWGNCNVTWRKLVLGDADATTGWYEKIWTEETIKMGIIPRGATKRAMMAGVWVRDDALGMCIDPVKVSDQIRDSEQTVYEVTGVLPFKEGSTLDHYEVDLTKLHLEEQ